MSFLFSFLEQAGVLFFSVEPTVITPLSLIPPQPFC
jgi:hypothetical protein